MNLDIFKEVITKEKAKFREQLAQLKKEHLGKWVLFKDGNVIDFFDDEDDAYAAGLKKFGTETPFLVTAIVDEEPKTTSFALELGTIYVSQI